MYICEMKHIFLMANYPANISGLCMYVGVCWGGGGGAKKAH